jgi:hypothetical protein
VKRSFLAPLLALIGCSPTTLTHGVPNLAQVDPEANVWRSGQITTAEGWTWVKGLGVQRVVKLNFAEEGSDDGARAIGLEVYDFAIEPNGDLVSVVELPDSERIALAVATLRRGNALVHCTHGQDRTGVVTGVYRLEVSRWRRSQAWGEMLDHGYHWELPALTAWWLDFDPVAQEGK